MSPRFLVRRLAPIFLLAGSLPAWAATAADDDATVPDVASAPPVAAAGVAGPVRAVPLLTLPAGARTALRRMAQAEDATLARATVHERDGQLIYEFYAVRRRGLLGREEYLLTEFREPVEAAEARRHARSLRGRVERLNTALHPEPPTLNP